MGPNQTSTVVVFYKVALDTACDGQVPGTVWQD